MINNKFFKKKIKNQNKIILYCENDNITYETLEIVINWECLQTNNLGFDI